MVATSWCLLIVMIAGANGAGWTGWLDRDDPSVTGDWEIVSHFDPKPCDGNAQLIQARMKGDSVVIASAFERITVGPDYGLLCQRNQQPHNSCFDYFVHYLVPKMSSKFNRDFQHVIGDNESKSLLSVVPDAWKDGEFIYWYANQGNYGLVHERLEIGPQYGLVCKNLEQSNNACRDYEVRFYCA